MTGQLERGGWLGGVSDRLLTPEVVQLSSTEGVVVRQGCPTDFHRGSISTAAPQRAGRNREMEPNVM